MLFRSRSDALLLYPEVSQNALGIHTYRIVVSDIFGERKRTLYTVTASQREQYLDSISPRGTYYTLQSPSYGILKTSSNHNTAHEFSGEVRAFRFSADERFIAFTRFLRKNGGYEIVLFDIERGQELVLQKSVTVPVLLWSDSEDDALFVGFGGSIKIFTGIREWGRGEKSDIAQKSLANVRGCNEFTLAGKTLYCVTKSDALGIAVENPYKETYKHRSFAYYIVAYSADDLFTDYHIMNKGPMFSYAASLPPHVTKILSIDERYLLLGASNYGHSIERFVILDATTGLVNRIESAANAAAEEFSKSLVDLFMRELVPIIYRGK